MSASEKLKALNDFRFDLDPDKGWNAIVAVVEAAEAMDPGGPGWFGDTAEGDVLAAALTALGEALS